MSTLLETIEHETGPNPAHSIVWLHGLGADGHDFEPIVPELDDPRLPPLRYVFPNAPVRPVTLNQGWPTRAWFDIFGLDAESRDDVDGIRAMRHTLYELLAREMSRGTPPEHIVLAGFSQGCAMALYTGLRMERRLAGLIGLSGYLPLRNRTAAEHHPANADTPIFMAHGTEDPVVPLAYGEASRDVLTALDHPVQWHTYPMPHAVCPEEIADIKAFLVQILAEPEE